VNLTGFVMKAGASPKAPFTLGRFYITCCVADAIPIGVTVDPTLAEGGFPANTWLDVTGALDNKSGSYVVDGRADRGGLRAEQSVSGLPLGLSRSR